MLINKGLENKSQLLIGNYRSKEISNPVKLTQNLDEKVEQEWSKSMVDPENTLNYTPSTHISRNKLSQVDNEVKIEDNSKK